MMKSKRFTALFVVLALLCSFMIVPVSAVEPLVYTATRNEDNQLIIDSYPQPGEYSISFTYCEYNTCISVVADSLLLSALEEDGVNYLIGSFAYDLDGIWVEFGVLISEFKVMFVVDANEPDVELDGVDNLSLTPVVVNDTDCEPTMNNFLSAIGAFFTSCINMLSDVVGIVLNSPVLLVSVFAIPAIFFVISIVARIKM